MPKEKKKKPDLTSKVGKYYVATKQKGLTKKEAQIVAGYSTPTHSTAIEASKEYQAIERYFKDELLTHITMSEIADALVDNIKQEGQDKVDRHARNTAISIALGQISPKDGQSSDDDQVIVVLKQND